MRLPPLRAKRDESNSWERQMRAGLKGTELNMLPIFIKGIVHPKMSILSCCTKPVLICILVLDTK